MSRSSDANLGSIYKLARRIEPPRNYAVWCHPVNARLLRDACPAPTPRFLGDRFGPVTTIGEITLFTSLAIPKFRMEWEFPRTPFVDYEERDEKWAIPLKFGRWVEGREPFFLLIDTTEPRRYQPFNLWVPLTGPIISNMA